MYFLVYVLRHDNKFTNEKDIKKTLTKYSFLIPKFKSNNLPTIQTNKTKCNSLFDR